MSLRSGLPMARSACESLGADLASPIRLLDALHSEGPGATLADRTAIEWTDATANFWRGCDKVSPGCAHCYMFTEQRRYGRDPSIVTLASPATFGAPLSRKWRARAEQIAESEGRRMRVFT